MNMLAVFGIGLFEAIMLAVIAAMVCLPLAIGLVVVMIVVSKNQRRD